MHKSFLQHKQQQATLNGMRAHLFRSKEQLGVTNEEEKAIELFFKLIEDKINGTGKKDKSVNATTEVTMN